MTVGVDYRPLTSSGSIRASDLMHDRAMYHAMLDKKQQVRRAHAAEVREQIEDFEHKLGWKMRKHLGPQWSEQRALELEEERTMGLKRLPVPRPPSPARHYDYSVNNPHAETPQHEYDMMKFDDTEMTNSNYGSRPATSAEMWRRPNTSFSSPNKYRTASSMGASSPASRRLGFMKGSMEMWTSQSMLEPIFMPSSATQRTAITTAHSIANRIPASATKQRRWEDGPGRQFWEMQDRQLRGALERNEGQMLRTAQAEGALLQQRYEERRGSAQRKKDEAFEQAKQRKEPFPRAKLFAEVRLMEQIKAEWESRENKRLHLGMDGTALEEEAKAVMRETAEFEERLKGMAKRRTKARW